MKCAWPDTSANTSPLSLTGRLPCEALAILLHVVLLFANTHHCLYTYKWFTAQSQLTLDPHFDTALLPIMYSFFFSIWDELRTSKMACQIIWPSYKKDNDIGLISHILCVDLIWYKAFTIPNVILFFLMALHVQL